MDKLLRTHPIPTDKAKKDLRWPSLILFRSNQKNFEIPEIQK